MYLVMPIITEHQDRWGAQIRKGSLDLVILSVLWNERLYGLDILRRLQSASLEVAEGTLYPILMRLKDDGLLESTWVEAEAGHPRKYYWLTRAGRQRARSMAQSWDAFAQSISELVLPIKNGRKRDENG
jgi:PadR family transcriptional regulator, regulatory protein PadR